MGIENSQEYQVLTERLEEIRWAIDGDCDDIDCDKYAHRNLLKKKYKPVLEHNYSCMKKLNTDEAALLRLLSLKKFRKYRYKKCNVCRRIVDSLDKKGIIVSFTRPSKTHKGGSEWHGVWTHRKCASKVKTPKGWKKGI